MGLTHKKNCLKIIDAIESILNLTDLKNLDDAISKLSSVKGIAQNVDDNISPYINLLIPISGSCKFHINQMIPKSAFAILVILAWLSVIGLLVPLAFLYAGPVIKWKILLLIGFSIGVIALIAYMGILIYQAIEAGKLDIPTYAKVVREGGRRVIF